MGPFAPISQLARGNGLNIHVVGTPSAEIARHVRALCQCPGRAKSLCEKSAESASSHPIRSSPDKKRPHLPAGPFVSAFHAASLRAGTVVPAVQNPNVLSGPGRLHDRPREPWHLLHSEAPKGDISSVLGNAQGARQKPIIKALKGRSNALPLSRSRTLANISFDRKPAGDYSKHCGLSGSASEGRAK